MDPVTFHKIKKVNKQFSASCLFFSHQLIQRIKSNISFENVNKDHAGTYYCTARNQAGAFIAKEKLTLDVKYAPDIEIDEEPIDASVNDDIEIMCSVDASPEATVTWFKDSIKIIEDDKSFQNNGDNYSLYIPSLSFSDSGNYACRAKVIY